MKTSVKSVSVCNKIISVEIPKETITREYSKVFNKISQTAKVPGFRPGKIPQNVLATRFAEEAKDEVLHELVNQAVQAVLSEHKLEPVLRPEIKDLDFTEEKLTFKAHVETRPVIKMGSYKGLKAKKKTTPVEDKEIDAVIQNIRKSSAKLSPVQGRGLELGDAFVGDLTVVVDDKEIQAVKDEWFEYEKERFLPEFIAGLAGMKPEETKKITVKFPKDYGQRDIAGKKGVLTITVKDIKSYELPDTDDEFLKQVGEYKSLDEFKAAVKRDLEGRKDKESEALLRDELLKQFVKSSNFELPQGLVEQNLDYLVNEETKNQQPGGKHDHEHGPDCDHDAEPKVDDKTTKELRKKLRERAENQVKLSFLFEEVAEKENMQVSEEDMTKRVYEISRQVRQPQEKVLEYYRKEKLMAGLANQILNEKVIQFLRDHAEITA